ncbi:MAG: TonB family protein [Thermodesulfovibrionales bacterium]
MAAAMIQDIRASYLFSTILLSIGFHLILVAVVFSFSARNRQTINAIDILLMSEFSGMAELQKTNEKSREPVAPIKTRNKSTPILQQHMSADSRIDNREVKSEVTNAVTAKTAISQLVNETIASGVSGKQGEIKEVPGDSTAEGKGSNRETASGSGMPASLAVPSVVEAEFGSISGPAFLHKEMPVYPSLARRLGKEGTVVLSLTVDEKGHLINVEILEHAAFGLTEAAVEAIRKSTFVPAKREGRPVTSKALLPIRFALQKNRQEVTEKK